MMNAKEREQCLKDMEVTASRFYCGAVKSGNHAFIEFTGLMNEYIKACRDAHESGQDFTDANVHAAGHLPLPGFRLQYINEKLDCIYGRTLKEESADDGAGV